MKLADWSLHFYRLPYAREVTWANAVEREGVYALLALSADSGARGVAEGTVKATWSGVSPRSLAAALEDVILPRLRDVDLADADAVAACWRGVPENALAKALADSACWTLRAAAAGVPLWSHWGGAPRVEVTWTVTRQAPAAMAAEAAEVCARHGFRTLKVKGGQGLDTDLAALREIRAAVGPRVALTVDANSAYAQGEAAGWVAAIAEAGAIVAEDPCALQPDAGFETLQRGASIPLLVDRSCASARDAALYLARGARALSAKPGRVGLSEARAVAAAAAARDARVSVGIYGESLLGTLVSLQLAATLPAARALAAEQTFYLMLTEQVTAQPLPVAQGCVELPHAPALADLVDWARVERCAL